MLARLANQPFLINVISFFLLTLMAMRANSAYLFYGLDGRFEVSLITQSSIFVPSLFGYTNDPIHGLGNIWFTVNTLWVPAYFLSLTGPGVFTNFPLAYAICATELFGATYLSARLLGLSRVVAVLAAWLLPLLVFQYVGWNKVPSTFRAFPHYATIAALSAIMASSLSWLSREHRQRSLAIAFLLFIGVTYIVVVAPTLLILVAPALAAFGLAALSLSTDRRDLVFRLALMSAVLVACVALGYAHFLMGLVTYTAAEIFRGLSVRHSGMSEVSMLFWQPFLPFLTIERVFVGAGLIGAGWTVWRSRGVLRSAAVAFLGIASAYLIVGMIHSYHYFWFGPPLWYFEGFLFPFHAIFAIALIMDLAWISLSAAAPLVGALGLNGPRVWQTASLLIPMAFAAGPWLYIRHELGAHSPNNPPYFAPHPQKETPITRLLKEEIGLTPGGPFRGRAASLTGRIFPTSTSVDVHKLWNMPNILAMFNTGNDHGYAGLWQDSIPTLFEYNPLITPPYFAFMRAFFTEAVDVQLRNLVVMRRIEPRLLAAIGVRFIITDKSVEGLRLRQTIEVPVSEDFLRNAGIRDPIPHFGLYLFELPGVNIGQYSPTEARTIATASEMIAVLRDATLDPTRSVVTADVLPSDLVPATLQAFDVGVGEFRVRAASAGRSVLVLPMEYSECLRAQPNRPIASSVRLFRANLLATGILFEGSLDVTIWYRTGPILNSRCRLQDAADMRKLDMKNVFRDKPELAPKGIYAPPIN